MTATDIPALIAEARNSTPSSILPRVYESLILRLADALEADHGTAEERFRNLVTVTNNAMRFQAERDRYRAALEAAYNAWHMETRGDAIDIMPPSPETAKRWWTMYCRECGIEEGMADSADNSRLIAQRDEHNRTVHAPEPSAEEERHAGHGHIGPYCIPEPQGEPSKALSVVDTGSGFGVIPASSGSPRKVTIRRPAQDEPSAWDGSVPDDDYGPWGGAEAKPQGEPSCDHDWQNRVAGGSKCRKCDLWQDKRVPTVQLMARKGGKTQALIDRMLAQATERGIRVEVVHPQGEPSDAEVRAALEAFYGEKRAAHMWDRREDMRAALRAARAAEQEGQEHG